MMKHGPQCLKAEVPKHTWCLNNICTEYKYLTVPFIKQLSTNSLMSISVSLTIQQLYEKNTHKLKEKKEQFYCICEYLQLLTNEMCMLVGS